MFWSWTFLLSPAEATPAATSTSPGCDDPPILGTLPEDGALDVAPDAVISVVYAGYSQFVCDDLTATLRDSGGADVPVASTDHHDGYADIRPLAPLTDGETYTATLIRTYATESLSFTVGSGRSVQAPPASIEALFARSCQFGFSTTIVETASFAPAGGDGVVSLWATIDGGVATRLASAVVGGMAQVGLEAFVPGGEEICTWLELIDETGEVAWTTDVVCEGPYACPIPEEPLSFEVEADRLCDGAFTSHVTATADFGGAEESSGTLSLVIETENGQSVGGHLGYSGESIVVLETDVVGGREVCVSLALLQPNGEPGWQTSPVCAEEHPGCPAEEGGDAGCGCDVGPSSGGLSIPFLFLAALRRRAPRRSA